MGSGPIADRGRDEEPLSRGAHSGFPGRSHAGGIVVTVALLAASTARAQGLGDPLNAPASGGAAPAGTTPAAETPQLGTPINEAEVRDAALGAGLPSDQAPFTPPATSELGAGRQGLDPIRPLSPNTALGIKLSPYVRVLPWARNATFHDTNIFRAPAGEEVSDIEVTNTVGVDVIMQSRRLELDLGYTGTLRTWVDESETVDEHRARLRFAAVGRLVSARARADAGWLARPDDPRFAGATVDRLVFDAGATVSVLLSRNVSLVPETYGTFTDFRERDLDRSDNLSWGGNLLLGLSPGGRVTILAGGGARILLYPGEDAVADDLRIYSAIIGVELRLRRLTGQIRVGYDWSEVIEERGGDDDPPRGFTTGIALAWQALRLTTISVDVTRGITFSTTSEAVFMTRAALAVTQQLPLRIAGTARVAWDLYEPTDDDQDPTVGVFGALGLAWEPRPWLQLGLEGSWFSRDNQGAAGDFEVLRLGAAITLRF